VSGTFGLSSQGTDYRGKQIELLVEIVARLHRIGVVANAGSPGALGEMRAFEATAKGFEVSGFEGRTPEDIPLWLMIATVRLCHVRDKARSLVRPQKGLESLPCTAGISRPSERLDRMCRRCCSPAPMR
jgi:hypothetical protein